MYADMSDLRLRFELSWGDVGRREEVWIEWTGYEWNCASTTELEEDLVQSL